MLPGILQVWPQGQGQQQHLGTCQKCRFYRLHSTLWGAGPMHLRSSQGFRCRLKGETPLVCFVMSVGQELGLSAGWTERLKRTKCLKDVLSCVRLFATPWTVAHQAPLPLEFSRQEYWNRLPFPSSVDLPNPGTEPGSPALQDDSLLSEPPGKPQRAVLSVGGGDVGRVLPGNSTIIT